MSGLSVNILLIFETSFWNTSAKQSCSSQADLSEGFTVQLGAGLFHPWVLLEVLSIHSSSACMSKIL